MTKFYINEREINPPVGITSIDQILSYADKQLLPVDSVIRLVNIDGTPLLQGDFSDNSAGLFEQIRNSERVEITTGTLEEIVRDSVSEALEYIDRVEEGIPALASSFQTNPGAKTFESLRQLYEGFYWLNLLLSKLAANFNIALEDMVVQGIPVKEHNSKFIAILQQLLDSQESGDVVLISDHLEYEIIPLVPIWREMFQKLAGHTAENP